MSTDNVSTPGHEGDGRGMPPDGRDKSRPYSSAAPQPASVGAFCERPDPPRATYRLQLHKDFGFAQAARLAEYLAALGISHIYTSPLLQAAPGSTHGYDVVNPHTVNTELGGEDGFVQFQEQLGRNRLGLVLDIVPNHMAISGRKNKLWWDVLENGPASIYADYFDIDWESREVRLRNVVLMPILGDYYGKVLTEGQLQLVREGGRFTLRYFDQALPIAPRSLVPLLRDAARRASDVDTAGAAYLTFLADAYEALPEASVREAEQVQRRHRDKEKLRELLGTLVADDAVAAQALDAVVADLNGNPGRLDGLITKQNYRLWYWKSAQGDLDYRRFFDINSLVGVRNELPDVFATTHATIMQWVRDGVIDGLRVDHVDGLRDPDEYLARLRERASRAWILVEKILEPGEKLPATWPIAGTTGYDYLNCAGGLFVDSGAGEPLTRFYGEFTGEPTDYATVLHEKKLLVLKGTPDIQGTLGSDVNRLTDKLLELADTSWRSRDYTRHHLREALCLVVAYFPVYRTYVCAEAGMARSGDIALIEQAVDQARMAAQNIPDPPAPEIFTLLGDILTLRYRTDDSGLDAALAADFVMRFQQLTGPAMAKGAEDTAFYCYNRLVSLNEVGGDPGRFGVSVAEFHAACGATQLHWPQTMLASSTHDTKRGEDVRARISLLSEMPERWCETVRRWAQRNERHWQGEGQEQGQGGVPDRNVEYLYYQTLIGAWPLPSDRAWEYMQKAIREAKQHTSWTEQNAPYEARVKAFVEGTLADEEFTREVEQLVAELAEPWYASALAQTLLKLTAPGVPDFYQGSELWDLSLVDPDNRRPVDFDRRRKLLAELERASPESLVDMVWEQRAEGLPKLHLIRQALALRACRPELFGLRSSYEPLEARGAKAEHVVAFSRRGEVVTVVPRLTLSLANDWADATLALPAGRWHNELTGETVRLCEDGAVALAELLRRFPVALLSRQPVPQDEK